MEQPTMFVCSTCGEEFSTAQQLRIHRLEQHSQMNETSALEIEPAERSNDEESGEVF